MRILILCCVLALVVGCDTMGGSAVVLKLKSQSNLASDNTAVEQALLVIDKTMAREGIRRVAVPANDYGHVAHYDGGGRFICSVVTRDGNLVVDFRNPHFGGGPPDAEVARVSEAVAQDLRSQYGAKQVRIKE